MVTRKSKWNDAKVKRYLAHLTRRAARREKNGKNKSTDKLVRKYQNARAKADPNYVPRLADTPKAGHHAPPLAIANKHKGKFAYGPRGSKKEKLRKRLYFISNSLQDRREAHAIVHIAEAIQGLNRQGNFKGTDAQLAAKGRRALYNLRYRDGRGIVVAVQNQLDRESGQAAQSMSIGAGANILYGQQSGDVDSDDTSSDADSDELNWESDSGTDTD